MRAVITRTRGSGVETPAPFATLVSRGRTVAASSTDGASSTDYAIDADYNTRWKSGTLPATFEIDITGLGLTWAVLSWLCEYISFYDGGSIAEVPGEYTIERKVSGSWSSALVTVTSSVYPARAHIVDLTSATAVRISITQRSAGGTAPSQINIDLWDVASCINPAHTQLTCGIFTLGDSITGAGLAPFKLSTSDARDSLGDQIYASCGRRAVQTNCGNSGYTVADTVSQAAAWVAATPFKYVTANLMTNDALQAINPTTSLARMNDLCDIIIAAGKTPIIPTVPWCDGADVTPYNAQIPTLLASYPTAIPGPDLYAYFNANQSYISGVHPTGPGYVAYLSQWVNWCISRGVF